MPLQQAIRDWVQQYCDQRAAPRLLMVAGTQGVGKTTALAGLSAACDGRVLVLSLDDFYLSLEQRRALAERVHPLCVTRGPPGTHDLGLLDAVLDELTAAPGTQPVALPHFDKSSDDRMPREVWREVTTTPDVIVLEGWLLGALADPAAPEAPAINDLERAHDSEGVWRAWQENHLAAEYAALWDRCDGFLYLDAPSFAIVPTWRSQQEESNLGLPAGQLPLERRAWVANFVQYYERISRRMLAGQRRQGFVLKVDENRQLRD